MALFKSKREKTKPNSASEQSAVVALSKDNKNIHKTTGVVWGMRITEKASAAAGENKYIFVVSPKANKNQIKHDINAKFGVDVVNINIVNLPAKERRRGAVVGWKPGIKKAIVEVAKGQKIEIQ
ncbi:MAG: 50S ribosomal protein L23 [bacterium]|nr:50S ribosomal protein L23 [bacterium]